MYNNLKMHTNGPTKFLSKSEYSGGNALKTGSDYNIFLWTQLQNERVEGSFKILSNLQPGAEIHHYSLPGIARLSLNNSSKRESTTSQLSIQLQNNFYHQDFFLISNLNLFPCNLNTLHLVLSSGRSLNSSAPSST